MRDKIYVAPDGLIFTDEAEYRQHLEAIRGEQD